ncbi:MULTISPECIES: fibronectin type III domain-containing protein [unclassified Streptomyces]|uniref:fibronectin type III domain-containing protein n=1 Tax=unclassified Streptomyces TaxID=2593676 RepID=UPI002E0EA04A|nr:PA14 domain-containing protein [Streptomyces sp. NBC_01240]
MRINKRAVCAALGLLLPATGVATLAASTAHAATPCASGVWTAKYYANTSFSGTPKKTTCDTAINENYGTGDPAGVALPRDNFGVRWTVSRDFGSGGPFTFSAAAQDGIRVYLDGVRKIDLWSNVSATRGKSVRVTIPKGTHTIRVDFAAFTGRANVKFTYAPVTSASVDKVKPLTPTGLKAAYSTSTLKTSLTWTKNVEMDLAGYRVYRRTGTSTTWTRISGTGLVTSPSYLDTPPATGDAYGYAVTAVDKAGNETARSAAQTVTSVDKTGPAAPTGVKAKGTPPAVTLTWHPDTTDDNPYYPGYWVYRATSPTGTFTRLGSGDVVIPAYTDASAEPGVTYWYKVRASDRLGNLSAFSAAVSAARPAAGADAAPAPTGVTADDWYDGNTVTWKPPAGATPTGYHVYFKSAADLDWTKLTSTPVTSTSLHHPTAPTGVLSQYYVTAVDASGAESLPSAIASATRLDGSGTGPWPTPEGLLARENTGGIELWWDPFQPPNGSAVGRYDHQMLYRAAGEGGTYEPVARLSLFATYYVDTTAPLNVPLAYKLVRVNGVGTASAPAFVSSIRDTPAVPGALTASDGVRETHVSWTSGGEADLKGFNIYRSTSPDVRVAPEYRLNSKPLKGHIIEVYSPDTIFEYSGPAPVHLVDHYIEPGVTYYYAITAVDIYGNESEPATGSATSTGWE